jgi:hypothetical protein
LKALDERVKVLSSFKWKATEENSPMLATRVQIRGDDNTDDI